MTTFTDFGFWTETGEPVTEDEIVEDLLMERGAIWSHEVALAPYEWAEMIRAHHARLIQGEIIEPQENVALVDRLERLS